MRLLRQGRETTHRGTGGGLVPLLGEGRESTAEGEITPGKSSRKSFASPTKWVANEEEAQRNERVFVGGGGGNE